jgi:hypothetical protein
MIARRRLLAFLVLAAAPLLAAHTPFKQWVIYRQTHLVVLASKDDPESFPLSKKVAAALIDELPESRARVALAPDVERVAALLRSRQISLAITTPETARILALGLDQFAPEGPIPLRALYALGDHVLVGHADFPREHGWLVVDALASHAGLDIAHAGPEPHVDDVPAHDGLTDYVSGTGGPPPEPEPQ